MVGGIFASAHNRWSFWHEKLLTPNSNRFREATILTLLHGFPNRFQIHGNNVFLLHWELVFTWSRGPMNQIQIKVFQSKVPKNKRDGLPKNTSSKVIKKCNLKLLRKEICNNYWSEFCNAGRTRSWGASLHHSLEVIKSWSPDVMSPLSIASAIASPRGCSDWYNAAESKWR